MTDHNPTHENPRLRCSDPTCDNHTLGRRGKQVGSVVVGVSSDGTAVRYDLKSVQCDYCGQYGTLEPFVEDKVSGPPQEYTFFVDARVTYRVSVVARSLEEAHERVADCLIDSNDEPEEFMWLNLDDPEFVEVAPVTERPGTAE